MKENEIIEYRKQMYLVLQNQIKEAIEKLDDDDLKFQKSIEAVTASIRHEQDEQIKSKEREACYRLIMADLVRDAKDERVKEARKYVPIPLSAYHSSEQEKKTRPSIPLEVKNETKEVKPRQTSDEKNIANIARAMGISEDAVKVMLEKQQKSKVVGS